MTATNATAIDLISCSRGAKFAEAMATYGRVLADLQHRHRRS